MANLIRDHQGRYYSFEQDVLVPYRLPEDIAESIRATGKIPTSIRRGAFVIEDHAGNFYRIPRKVMKQHLIPEDRLPSVLKDFKAKYITKLTPGSVEELSYDCGPKWY